MKQGPNPVLFANYMLYIFVRLLEIVLNVLPEPTAFAVGRALGRLVFVLVPDRKEAALDNLSIAFGKEKSREWIRRTALRSFQHVGTIAVEFFRIRRWSEDQMADGGVGEGYPLYVLGIGGSAGEVNSFSIKMSDTWNSWNLLDVADVGAAFEHQGGHGVAQQVAGALLVDPSLADVVAHHHAQSIWPQTVAIVGQKQVAVVTLPGQAGPRLDKVLVEPGHRPITDRHHSVFAALALLHKKRASLHVEVKELEVYEL